MEIPFEKFYELVGQNLAGLNGQNQSEENIAFLLNFSSRIEFLPILRNFLGRCLNSDGHVLFILNAMKEVIKRRGCVMPSVVLLDHYQFLRDFIFNSSTAFVQRIPLLRIASDAIAVTIRHIYEQSQGNQPVINNIIEFFNGDDEKRLVALNILISVVDIFQFRLPHLSITDQFHINRLFKDTYAGYFFSLSCQLMNGSLETILASLELMNSCLKMYIPEEEKLENRVSYPPKFETFYTEEFMKRIFELINEQQTSNLSLSLLCKLLMGANVINPDQKIGFLEFCINNLIGIYHQENIDHLLLCKVTYILEMLLNNSTNNRFNFLQSQFAEPFFKTIIEYSFHIFTLCDPNLTRYLLLFWIKVSNWKDIQDEFIQNVFIGYIQRTLDSIKQNPGSWITLFHSPNELDSFETSLWLTHPRFYQMLYDIIIGQIQGNVDNVLCEAFLVRLVSSHLLKRTNIIESNVLYNQVIEFIRISNASVHSLILSNVEVAFIFEMAVNEFIYNFQKTQFAHVRVSSTSYEETNARKEYEQNCLNIFIERMIIDVNEFSSIKGCGLLVMKTLMCMKALVDKTEIRDYISNLLESLTNHQIIISYNEQDPNEIKKPRSLLQQIYMSLINTREQLIQFLISYDQRFNELKSNSIDNPKEVFELYRDLRGVVQGAYQGKDKVTKIFTVFNWFSQAHFEDTITIIQRHSNNALIVNAICHFWISLFPDKYPENIIKPTSGFGINMFKSSLAIIGIVINNCAKNLDIFYILFKVIKCCLSTKYANFGVMKFYNDESLMQMINLFFQMLSSINFDVIRGIKKIQKNILSSMEAINDLIDIEIILQNEQMVNIISDLTCKCIMLNDKELFDLSFNVIIPIARMNVSIFRKHFIAILNDFVNSDEKLNMKAGELLLICFLNENEFCIKIFEDICNAFEPMFRENIKEILTKLFFGFEMPITEQKLKQFEVNLGDFINTMKRYRINFIDYPILTKYLQ